MNKIIAFLFGKRSESGRLISVSNSLSSVSELDDEDCELDSNLVSQGQGSVNVCDIYSNTRLYGGSLQEPSRKGLIPEDRTPSIEMRIDYSTSLLSTAQTVLFNLHDSSALTATKSLPVDDNEDASVSLRETFMRRTECERLSFSKCDRSWRVLLRSFSSSSRNMKGRGKTWRPVVVKLEEASLKFHANGFESSPPFQIVPLLWTNEFSIPKYQTSQGGQPRLLTTTLLNTFPGCSSKRALIKCPSLRKKTGFKVAKIGCTNHTIIYDLIETVQRCVFSFPGFRQRGIRYRKDRVFVEMQDVYEVLQNENDSETTMGVHNVHIKVKTLVSGSPKCSITLNSFDDQVRKISFHKCVQGKSPQNPLIVTFVPLDDCWFQLLHLKLVDNKPPPLRCQITLIIHVSNRIELRAQVFATTPTRPDAAHVTARQVTLKFHVPLSCLSKKGLVEHGVHNTRVSKGNVHYYPTDESMLWSIRKLPLKTHKNFCGPLNEKPLASLSCDVNPTSPFNPHDFTKRHVNMDFTMPGNNVLDIKEFTLGSRKFDNLKTNHASVFRVLIPVHIFRI